MKKWNNLYKKIKIFIKRISLNEYIKKNIKLNENYKINSN